jgi:hypothetical protein
MSYQPDNKRKIYNVLYGDINGKDDQCQIYYNFQYFALRINKDWSAISKYISTTNMNDL